MSTRLGLNHQYSAPRLNYTITLPQLNATQLESLFPEQFSEKLRRVPAVCLDKLHPKKTDPVPYVEYIDQGLWKSRITFQKDTSHSVLRSKMHAQTAHESLDALCENELRRRFPGYQVIQGIQASFKNRFPTLARMVLGTERFFKEFTQKEINKYKKQIAHSAIDRDDLICTPKIDDPQLRSKLNIQDDVILQTEHLFAKNSPLNGQSFIREGHTVQLSQAIACSNDRKVENTGNLRVVQTKNKESLCYTGRADSDHKALEQATFIFLNELKTKGKGLTKGQDDVYQLDYVVNSLLTVPLIFSRESPFAPFPEREYLENELKAFARLKQKGTIVIEDPNSPGRTYRVKFNPITFSRSLNIFTRLENWLPPFFTGRSRAQEISEKGLTTLQAFADRKMNERVKTALQALEQHAKEDHLRPEEELLIRDYLCKLLDLPIVYHCKSSTDRTSIPIALSSALQQWIELQLPLPVDLCDLIKDTRFKELIALNWMTGHQITRYARGAKGVVAGEKLNNKNLGLSLSRGISQNPAVENLLPRRYLKDFPLSTIIKTSSLYLLLLVPLFVVFYIPLITATAIRHIAWTVTQGKNRHWVGPGKFTLPALPLTLIFNFFTIFPGKVLNEDSPQVGQRQLIGGGKRGGTEDIER